MSPRVDYDRIAGQYDGRYERNDYSGFEAAIREFAAVDPGAGRPQMLEVGCGTGHWLRVLHGAGVDVVGVDLSQAMLHVARRHDPTPRLLRARAEALPFASGAFDRLFLVNALHHFADRAAFYREARRVLRDGGRLLTIGLDPHAGIDRWWIYDYFPSALEHDRRRYPSVQDIREGLGRSGFAGCATREVQHLPARMPVSEASARGFLERSSTSQLMVISDEEFAAGLARVHAPGTGDERILCADLHVYATSARAV